MGLISSLAVATAPQFQTLTAKPVSRVNAAQATAGFDTQTAAQIMAQALGGAEVPAEANLRPVLAPASSEAIFKGLLPGQPALDQATQGMFAQIETETEVDGITLDGIPYLNDGAVLLDDLPQIATPAPAKVAPEKAAPTAMAPVAAQPMRPEVEVQAAPEQAKSDQAERAYQDAREISALQAEAEPQAKPAAPDQAEPPPEARVDTRA